MNEGIRNYLEEFLKHLPTTTTLSKIGILFAGISSRFCLLMIILDMIILMVLDYSDLVWLRFYFIIVVLLLFFFTDFVGSADFLILLRCNRRIILARFSSTLVLEVVSATDFLLFYNSTAGAVTLFLGLFPALDLSLGFGTFSASALDFYELL